MAKYNLFELGESNADLSVELPNFFDKWEAEIAAAEPIFEIKGTRLEMLARDLAQHQGHYSRLAIHARGVSKWLENQKAKIEARYIKNYNNAPRALGVKEQSQYLNGEKDIVEMNQLIIQTALYQGQFDEIVESLKQMGWMIGHITKLRVAELQSVEI